MIPLDGESLTEEEAYKRYREQLGKVARPYGYTHGHEDAEAVAALAFVKACRAYDAARGVPFGPFMMVRVKYALAEYAGKPKSGVYVPYRTVALRHKIRKTGLLDSPAPEIAEALGCTEAQVLRALKAEGVMTTLSLDAPGAHPADDDNEALLGDILPGPLDDLTVQDVQAFEESLSERERRVLEGRRTGATNVDAAAAMGIAPRTLTRTLDVIRRKAYKIFIKEE